MHEKRKQREITLIQEYQKNDTTWKYSLDLLTDLFLEFIPPGSAVLDVGCGRGNYVLEHIPSTLLNTLTISGLDVSESAVRGNKLIQKIFFGNIENASMLPDNQYDAVILIWVLEHIHNPLLTLKEITRVTKPGGKIFFITPYKYYAPIVLKRILPTVVLLKTIRWLYGRSEQDVFPTYYMINTTADIRKYAHNAGLTILECRHNFDPTYTSFDNSTFKTSLILKNLMGHFMDAHIIGVLEKLDKGIANANS